MVPVTELEMSINNTFGSILNEIQLSNLNFSLQVTPFTAYITLKKSVQKDVNGVPATPSPPLLYLLQQAQQVILQLQGENSKLKTSVATLEEKTKSAINENDVLVDTVKEVNEEAAGLAAINNNLRDKINEAEKESSKIKSEKIMLESKIKEARKKYDVELNDLQNQVKNLTKTIKTKEKELLHLDKIVENTRSTLKNVKSENSQLKTIKSKLETEKRKLENQKVKKDKGKMKLMKSENNDENANEKVVEMNTENAVTSNVSSPMDIISLVSHVVPNIHAASDRPINNEQLETIEAKGIELEVKEDGFIGPRLPRVMTKEEVRALFRELFPNADKYK